MASYVEPNRSLVLRRRSADYPGNGKRIHGIVFDHPSMPKIMTVSSVRNQDARKNPAPKQHVDRPPFGTRGSPPALIHSPSTRATGSTPGCHSAQRTYRLPYTVCSKSSSQRHSLTYQQARADNTSTYGLPSGSRINARPIVSGEAPMAELSCFPAQLENPTLRYSQPYQNYQPESTSGLGEFNRHDHFEHQVTPSRISGGNSTTFNCHPRNTQRSSSYEQYLPASQPEVLKHTTLTSKTPVYPEQHVNRRNSTGGIRHYPSSDVNTYAEYTAKCNNYADEASKEFARNFHDNVWRESRERTAETGLGGTSSSFVASPTFRSVSASDGCHTFVSCGERRICECESGSVQKEIRILKSSSSKESNPTRFSSATSPASKMDDLPYRRPIETLEAVTSWSHTYVGGTQGSNGSIREKLGHKDVHLHKDQYKTNVRDLGRKESMQVVIISDSEDEVEIGPGHSLETSPISEMEDSASDIFPVVEVVGHAKREQLAANDSPKAVKLPGILIGGLISSSATVKNEELTKEGGTKTKDCTKNLKPEKSVKMDAVGYLSNSTKKDEESDKFSRRFTLSEHNDVGSWCEKERGVLSEQVLGNRGIGKNSSSCIAKICRNPFVHDGDVFNDRTCKAPNINCTRLALDENNNLSDSSHKSVVKHEVNLDSVNTKIGACCKMDDGVSVRCSEKAASKCECYPHSNERYLCSDGHGRSLVKDKRNFQFVTKESNKTSEHGGVDSSRNGSSSPTYELGFLTQQLSKLTDDEMKSEIRKSEPEVGLGTVEKTCAIEKIAGKLLLNAKKEKLKFDPCNELHSGTRGCRRSEHGCPSIKSDVPPLKSVTKPTGIVVGIKQARYDKEPLEPKVGDYSELSKDGGEGIECNRTYNVLKSCEKASDEIGKGFGLLQFSVVEKNAGTTWRNEADCSKYPDGSLSKSITSQQWEAFSMKLEKGTARRQCACVKPEVTLGQAFGKGLGKDKPFAPENVGQSAMKDESENNRGVGISADSLKRVACTITGNDARHRGLDSKAEHIVQNSGIDKCTGLEKSKAKPIAVKSVQPREVSLCEEVRVNVVRKRPNSCSSISENSHELDKDSDCGNAHYSENSKRQKITESDSDEYARKFVLSSSRGWFSTSGVSKPCPDGRPREVCSNELLKANQEAGNNMNDSHVPPRSQVQDTSGEDITSIARKSIIRATPKVESVVSNTNSGKLVCDERRPENSEKSPEEENPEKRKVLTAEEWKEILVGRIEQVRESIEVEQTPWKAKNKRKVLGKLEQQLKGWDDCPSIGDAAFISRRLQFLRTMRNQYELMKKIGAQRNALKNTVQVAPERTMTEERLETEVLKTFNSSNEKKRTNLMKRNSSSR